MRFNKFLVCVTMIFVGVALFGCKKTPVESSLSTQTTTEVSSLENSIDNSQSIINLLVSDSEYTPSTMQEAISLVHDSVVTIYAETSAGTSAGAGVLVGYSDTDSYIITCHHVIESGYSFSIDFNDGTSQIAALVGGDAETDIAVLSIPITGLTYSSLVAESSSIALGSSVFAIGNPLGTLGGSVTSGIISALSRDITMDNGTVMNVIQTDAAINSGNSGGGLFNMNGELIGMVSAKYSATGVEGLGFAIPADTLVDVATDLIKYGHIEGKFDLGLTLQQQISYFSRDIYTVVTEVRSDGCAYGKLMKNDIITKIDFIYQDNRETKSLSIDNQTTMATISTFLDDESLRIGDSIVFKIQRGSFQVTEMEVTVPIVQYHYTQPLA